MEERTEYPFTARERLYFERLIQSFNAQVAAGIQMLCTQQELVGQWRMKIDGSGIERADLALPLPAAVPEEVKANGLA
jgi:hypothetical protein